jgi:hypothetical protein
VGKHGPEESEPLRPSAQLHQEAFLLETGLRQGWELSQVAELAEASKKSCFVVDSLQRPPIQLQRTLAGNMKVPKGELELNTKDDNWGVQIRYLDRKRFVRNFYCMGQTQERQNGPKSVNY